MRRKLLAAVAMLAVMASALTIGNAASLTVDGGHLATTQATPCAASVTVTRTEPVYLLWIFLIGYQGVRVSGDLDACRGRTIAVTGTGGTPSVTGTVPATGSTTMTWSNLARYGTNVAFVVAIDGWHVPATTVSS